MAGKHSKPSFFWDELPDWIRTVVLTVMVALLIQRFVFTLARVDGSSMQETLHTREMMAVVRATYFFRGPERGEVVLCRYPNMEEDCVKRVIGLPGERVKIVDSTVFIDGEPLEEAYGILPETADFPEVAVRENEYFVLGDNRAVSLDSRMVGTLARNSIKGHCVAVVWPSAEWGAIQ